MGEIHIDTIENFSECILDEVAEYRVSKTTLDELRILRRIYDLVDTISAELKEQYKLVEGDGIYIL